MSENNSVTETTRSRSHASGWPVPKLFTDSMTSTPEFHSQVLRRRAILSTERTWFTRGREELELEREAYLNFSQVLLRQ
jgi:hypothetical protein